MTSQDPFAVFDLQERLVLDGADLESRYHALARRFHPDRFMTKSPAEREAAGEAMERINAAHRALRDPIERLRRVLARHGVKADGRQGMPVELAETYFDLQETLGDLATATGEARSELLGSARRLRERIQASADEAASRMTALGVEWDAAPRRETLEALALTLDRHTYLLSMLRDIDGKLRNLIEPPPRGPDKTRHALKRAAGSGSQEKFRQTLDPAPPGGGESPPEAQASK